MGSGFPSATSRVFSAVPFDVYRHLLQVPLLSYSLLASKRVPVKAAKPDGFAPIILVHGLGGRRGDLLPLECYLRLHGRRRVYRICLRRKRSVKAMSHTLAKFIERVIAVNGTEQVDIVGYSLGGIIARMAIKTHGLESRVGTLVTMGTPHHGTHPAHYVDTALGRALRPQSDVIRELREASWPQGVRGVTLWSRNDLFVLPPEAAAVEGTRVIDMSPFTHFSYLIDPRAWAAVLDALVSEESTAAPRRRVAP